MSGTGDNARNRRSSGSMVVLVRTRSRATYLFAESEAGVRWCRIPRPGARPWVATGLESTMPRIVPGERVLLVDLRTTPVTEVAILPIADGGLDRAIAAVGGSAVAGLTY